MINIKKIIFMTRESKASNKIRRNTIKVKEKIK